MQLSKEQLEKLKERGIDVERLIKSLERRRENEHVCKCWYTDPDCNCSLKTVEDGATL